MLLWRKACDLPSRIFCVPLMSQAPRAEGKMKPSFSGLNQPPAYIPIASQLDALSVNPGAASAHQEQSHLSAGQAGTSANRRNFSSSSSSSSSAAGEKVETGGGMAWPGRQMQALTNAGPSNRGHPTQTRQKHGRKRYDEQQSVGNVQRSAQEDRIYWLGRTLTSILRHRAVELGLYIRSDGYIPVTDLLKLNIKTRAGVPLSFHTVDDVLKAVEKDNKQRFGISTDENNGQLLIRANQGHSLTVVKTEELLEPILSASEIPVCVHGTYISNLKSIMATGLKRMTRNHVHFASGLPEEDGVISGMRSSCNALIYLDVEKAMTDGMKFYRSKNNVILTEGFDGVVPVKYFSKIEKWPGRETICI